MDFPFVDTHICLARSRCENINALTGIMYHHAKLADLVDMLAVENPARPFGNGCRFFAISISSQANFADTILIKSNTDEPTAPIDGWPYGNPLGRRSTDHWLKARWHESEMPPDLSQGIVTFTLGRRSNYHWHKARQHSH